MSACSVNTLWYALMWGQRFSVVWLSPGAGRVAGAPFSATAAAVGFQMIGPGLRGRWGRAPGTDRGPVDEGDRRLSARSHSGEMAMSRHRGRGEGAQAASDHAPDGRSSSDRRIKEIADLRKTDWTDSVISYKDASHYDPQQHQFSVSRLRADNRRGEGSCRQWIDAGQTRAGMHSRALWQISLIHPHAMVDRP